MDEGTEKILKVELIRIFPLFDDQHSSKFSGFSKAFTKKLK
jgi:hypothetical protein